MSYRCVISKLSSYSYFSNIISKIEVLEKKIKKKESFFDKKIFYVAVIINVIGMSFLFQGEQQLMLWGLFMTPISFLFSLVCLELLSIYIIGKITQDDKIALHEQHKKFFNDLTNDPSLMKQVYLLATNDESKKYFDFMIESIMKKNPSHFFFCFDELLKSHQNDEYNKEKQEATKREQEIKEVLIKKYTQEQKKEMYQL